MVSGLTSGLHPAASHLSHRAFKSWNSAALVTGAEFIPVSTTVKIYALFSWDSGTSELPSKDDSLVPKSSLHNIRIIVSYQWSLLYNLDSMKNSNRFVSTNIFQQSYWSNKNLLNRSYHFFSCMIRLGQPFDKDFRIRK